MVEKAKTRLISVCTQAITAAKSAVNAPMYATPCKTSGVWKQVSDDPLFRYKLFVQSGFELPEDFLTSHLTVVRQTGYTTKEEYEAAVQEAFLEIKKQTIHLPPMKEMMVNFLASKGATPDQIKRSKQLLSKVTPKEQQ